MIIFLFGLRSYLGWRVIGGKLTMFTIVIAALIVLLCGPCILQCIMNFVTQRLMSFSQMRGRRAGCNISLWMMLILWVKSIKRGEWRRKQTEQAPCWKQDSISGQTVDFELDAQYLWKRHTNWKTRPPGWKSPRARTETFCCLKEYPYYLCNPIESYILLCLLEYDHRPIDTYLGLTT